MKYYTVIIVLIVFLSGCNSMKKYYLADTGPNETFLVELIDSVSKKGMMSRKPILVIDGIEYGDSLKIDLKRMKLYKDDIYRINILKDKAALENFGRGGRGFVVIATKGEIFKKK